MHKTGGQGALQGDQPRIMHIITGLPTGGAEHSLLKLLSNHKYGCSNLLVVSLRGRKNLTPLVEDLGVEVRSLGMRDGVPAAIALWKLARLVRYWKPDLLQGWMYHGNLAASFAAFAAGGQVPTLWNVHHSLHDIGTEKFLTRLVIRVGAYLSSRPHAIIYCSEVAARQHEAYGFSHGSSIVIPNGFDCERFKPSPETRARLRAELKIARDLWLVGLVARYHPQKDHPNFIRAAGILARRNVNVHYVLLGPGVDSTNQDLAQLITSAGIHDRVHLLGEQSDVSRIMPGLDILTSSSFGEAFPNVLGEAMACGIPCVATDVGDSARIIGNTGVVVPPRDADALASAWAKLLTLSNEERRRLGEAARQRIIQDYTLESVVDRYHDLYSRVITAYGQRLLA